MKRPNLRTECRFAASKLTDNHSINIGNSFFGIISKSPRVLNYAIGLMCTVFILYSCDGGDKSQGFKTSTEACSIYGEYLHDLSKCDSLSLEETLVRIKQWQVLRDSVYHCIAIDTTARNHGECHSEAENITNDIKNELFRLSDLHVVSFTDLIRFNKGCLPGYRYSELIQYKSDVENFFNQLDSVNPPHLSSDRLIKEYRAFLVHSQEEGFSSPATLFSFFRNEDLYFRGFLACLDDFEDLDMTDISRLTEKCCYDILKLSDSDHAELNELKCLMIMRTSRRLLQNAQVCLDNLKKDGCRLSEEQASAYLWMTLQPYSTIGPLGLSLLTDKDERLFNRLSDAMPYVLSELNVYLSIDYDNIIYLPKQILKATIYNL